MHINLSLFNESKKRKTYNILVSGAHVFSLSSLQSQSSHPSIIDLYPSWNHVPKGNNARNSEILHYAAHSISHHYTSLHCITIHHSSLTCTTLRWIAVQFIVLHGTKFNYNSLHCTALHCTTLMLGSCRPRRKCDNLLPRRIEDVKIIWQYAIHCNALLFTEV